MGQNATHRVLFVDDEPNLLNSFKRAFRKEPFEVLTATSPDEAFSLLDKVEIDAVVSDQDMPGMRGTEFLKKVKESYPDTVRFMLTGKATLDVAIQAINEGDIRRFFSKPCNEVDLAHTIRQSLQQKDLIVEAKRLLLKVRKQAETLDQIEAENPGITKVDRDSDGAIVIEDSSGDLESLMTEIRKTLGVRVFRYEPDAGDQLK